MKSIEHRIIYKNIFDKSEIPKIFLEKNGKKDINHLNKYGYKKLYETFYKLVYESIL